MEILSSGTRARDHGIKLRRYAAARVPHYWIVDPTARALEVHRLAESGYDLGGRYGPGEVFRPALFQVWRSPLTSSGSERAVASGFSWRAVRAVRSPLT